MMVEIGQLVVHVQLFVIGEEDVAHFELVGFAVVDSQIMMISQSWIVVDKSWLCWCC